MRRLYTALLLSVTLAFLGCGGGGGGGTTTTTVTSDATGVWRGTFTQNGVGTFNLVGLIYGNQLRFISADANALFEGTVTVTGTSFTATTTDIAISGGAYATSTLTGTVITSSTLSGTFTSSNGSSGSFSLTYDPVTTRGASLVTTDANWSATDGVYTVALAIDSNGLITGSDTDGCVYNGTIAVQNPAINIYALSLSATTCGVFNGSYAGYGVVNDTTVTNDTLTFVVSNANYIVAGDLTRQ